LKRILFSVKLFSGNRCSISQIVCGPVEGFNLYHTDNLVATGANFMVECLRQAIRDVGELLERHSVAHDETIKMRLPKKLILMFDNCPSENKVGYFS
jgi:hypothetical protein